MLREILEGHGHVGIKAVRNSAGVTSGGSPGYPHQPSRDRSRGASNKYRAAFPCTYTEREMLFGYEVAVEALWLQV
jgi:hypothetical protein